MSITRKHCEWCGLPMARCLCGFLSATNAATDAWAALKKSLADAIADSFNGQFKLPPKTTPPREPSINPVSQKKRRRMARRK